MKILFIPQAGALGYGGITRCLAIATTAIMRGHAVGFVVPQDYPLVANDALETLYSTPKPMPRSDLGAGESNTFSRSLLIRGMADADYLAAAVHAELDAIQTFRPDFIITENQISVPFSAALSGVPYAATAATINLSRAGSEQDQDEEIVIQALRGFGRKVGTGDIDCLEFLLHGRAALNIAPTIPLLEPELKRLPNVLYVGPLLHAPVELAPINWRSQLPRIVVYLSRGLVTLENFLPVLSRVIPEDQFAVLVAIREGESVGADLCRSFTFCVNPGLLRAIQGADFVITRGGQNTLMGCMLMGTPVIGTPGYSTEPTFNIDGLVSEGAAAKVEGIPTIEDLAKAIELVGHGETRRHAQRMGNALRQHNGAIDVVSAIETIFC